MIWQAFKAWRQRRRAAKEEMYWASVRCVASMMKADASRLAAVDRIQRAQLASVEPISQRVH